MREKLIELLRACPYRPRPNLMWELIADYLIANGVTFVKDNDVPNKWVPVSERLPEDDLPKDSKVKTIKVLVLYKTSMGVPVVRTQIRQKGCRYHRDEWSWSKFEPITHWMPLPEPPKEG